MKGFLPPRVFRAVLAPSCPGVCEANPLIEPFYASLSEKGHFVVEEGGGMGHRAVERLREWLWCKRDHFNMDGALSYCG